MTLIGKLHALDLFSGIGGNSIGLKDYVQPVAYCEADRHAQAVLFSRMSDGSLPRAPICTDVTKLDGRDFQGIVDIIIAGFPCQDISVAGKGAGLEGERSGLFYEVVRLAKEIEPSFLFLENVPAIRTRGLDRVIEELTALGYDLRWTMLSASDVGAPHKRERWFLLGYSKYNGLFTSKKFGGNEADHEEEQTRSHSAIEPKGASTYREIPGGISPLAHSNIERHTQWKRSFEAGWSAQDLGPMRCGEIERSTSRCVWWAIEPNMGRVAHGVPQRVDRIKRLGNAVVPAQAKAAFEILMGVRPCTT
jgi:DNA (cytosine-5)-methyltransferase 1